MKKLLSLFLFFSLLGVVTAAALPAPSLSTSSHDGVEYNKWRNSSYYVRALEAMAEEDDSSAVTYLKKEIAVHPRNGYALCLLADLEFTNVLNEYFTSDDQQSNHAAIKSAIDHVERGVALIPEADAENRCKYLWESVLSLLVTCNETYMDKSGELIERAMKIHPCPDAIEVRVRYLMARDPGANMTLIESDLDKLFKSKSPLGCINTSTDYITFLVSAEEDQRLIALCDKIAGMISPDDLTKDERKAKTILGILRGHSYERLGKLEDAADNYLDALEAEYDDCDDMLRIARLDPQMMLIKIGQRQFTSEDEDAPWDYCTALVKELVTHEYADAAKLYTKIVTSRMISRVESEVPLEKCMKCYIMSGDTIQALNYAAALDLTKPGGLIGYRDDLLINLGQVDEPLKSVETRIAAGVFGPVRGTMTADLYTIAGRLNMLKSRPDVAESCFKKSLELEGDDPNANLLCALALQRQNRAAEALPLLERVIAQEKVIGKDVDPDDDEEIIDSGWYATLAAHILRGDTMVNDTATVVQSIADMEERLIKYTEEVLHGIDDYIDNDNGFYAIAKLYALLGDDEHAALNISRFFSFSNDGYAVGRVMLETEFDAVREMPAFKNVVNTFREFYSAGHAQSE